MIFDAPKSLAREASKAMISAIYKQKNNNLRYMCVSTRIMRDPMIPNAK